MSMGADVVAHLKRVSNVPVFVDERESSAGPSILISSMKLGDVVSISSTLYRFTHEVWRNLPSPPENERMFVLMWLICSEGYDVNHQTIRWEGSSANTFVHLWSILDRLKTNLESIDMDWLIGARDPVGYSSYLNMTGPADRFIYPSMDIVPPHIETMIRDMNRCEYKEPKRGYNSNYDLMIALMMPKKRNVINPNTMFMNNSRIAFSKLNKS